MTKEEGAKIRYVKIEWDDGTIEVIYVPLAVASITIDATARKKWGAMK